MSPERLLSPYRYPPCVILVRTPIEMYSSYLHEHPRKTIGPAPDYGIRNELISYAHEVRKKKERVEIPARRLGADQAAPQPAGVRLSSYGHQSLLWTGPSPVDKVFHR